MSIYILIGGRSIKNLLNPCLEKKIFDIYNLNNPNILYFPQACLDDMEKSFDKFKKLMQDYKCNIKCCYDLNDKDSLINLLSWSDVLYFGGGHADDLIKVVKSSSLSNLILDYNKMIIGISAGAIMLSAHGMGDRYAYTNAYRTYNYQMVEGLGICDFTCCPHYDHDGLWCYNDAVIKYDYDGYAIEDDTAIIWDGEKVRVVKSDLSKSVYKFVKNEKYKMISLYEE